MLSRRTVNPARWTRFLPEFGVVTVGVGLSLAAFLSVREGENEALKASFEREALEALDGIALELAAATDVVVGYAHHLALVPGERCGSQVYARSILERHPSLRGLSWNTLVSRDERDTFEAAQQARRPGFLLTERSRDGHLERAGARDRYVAVTCMEPETGNEKAIGYDLASDPVRAEAINRTLRSGKPAATARIRLVQETGRAAGVLVLQSARAPVSGQVVGCVSAVLRIDDVIERSLGKRATGARIVLEDLAGKRPEVLYPPESPPIRGDGLEVVRPLNVADRPWRLRALLPRAELDKRKSAQPWAWLAAGSFAMLLALRALRSERASRQLLRNVLPVHVAQRLERGEGRISDHHEEVAVLFADLVGFTGIAARLSPDELVRLLEDLFTRFDAITAAAGFEKIKTIGDSYMAVGGLDGTGDSAFRAVRMGQALVRATAEKGLRLRIGIHLGPVVAGVIGRTRLSFDLWGETVNVASRMEAHGLPGCILLSAEAYAALSGRIPCEARGTVTMKGLGDRPTWLVREGSSA